MLKSRVQQTCDYRILVKWQFDGVFEEINIPLEIFKTIVQNPLNLR